MQPVVALEHLSNNQNSGPTLDPTENSPRSCFPTTDVMSTDLPPCSDDLSEEPPLKEEKGEENSVLALPQRTQLPDRIQVSMLYIGNLPYEGCEVYLRQILHAQEVTFNNLVVNREGGYAMVECTDQNMADKAIDKLNRHCFLGSTLHVEPVAPLNNDSNGSSLLALVPSTASETTLFIHNAPTKNAEIVELKNAMTQFGVNVVSLEATQNSAGKLVATVATGDQADRVVQEMHGRNFKGNTLTVERAGSQSRDMVDSRGLDTISNQEVPNHVLAIMGPKASESSSSNAPPGRRLPALRPQRPRRRRGGMSAPMPVLPEPQLMGIIGNNTDFPLRLLVPGEMVGAIIGRQGTTIRRIIKETRARVDVHRKDSARSEQALTIYGKPENCSAACRRILLVMQEEARNNVETQHRAEDLCIKVLAQSNLIGRLIGKGGGNIRRIMEETGATISVMSERGMSAESIVVIQGETQAMLTAEARVSGKLRQCHEADFAANNSLPAVTAPLALPMTPFHTSTSITLPTPSQTNHAEIVYLHIPHRAGAAIIGTRGNCIREFMRQSGAYIRVPSLTDSDQTLQTFRRKIIIIGNSEAQWKAQWLIAEKLREEGWKDAPLTVELRVPNQEIARLIGHRGENVAPLQRATGTSIQLPWCEDDGMQPVLITGSFHDIQVAQKKVRELIGSEPPPQHHQVTAPVITSMQPFIRRESKPLPQTMPDFGFPSHFKRPSGPSTSTAPTPYMMTPIHIQKPTPCRSNASITPPPLRDLLDVESDCIRAPKTPTAQGQRVGKKPSESFRSGDEWGITIVELDRRGNRLKSQETKVENARRETKLMKDAARTTRAAAGGETGEK